MSENNKNKYVSLSDSKINTIVYLTNQGKIVKIKEYISQIRNDSAVTKKMALNKIRDIINENNDDIWTQAQEGKLEKVKSSEIKKVDIEKIKEQLQNIFDYCFKNSNDNSISKNKTMNILKNMCNDSLKKDSWKNFS